VEQKKKNLKKKKREEKDGLSTLEKVGQDGEKSPEVKTSVGGRTGKNRKKKNRVTASRKMPPGKKP